MPGFRGLYQALDAPLKIQFTVWFTIVVFSKLIWLNWWSLGFALIEINGANSPIYCPFESAEKSSGGS